MVEAAVRGMGAAGVLAVTVLTSLDARDLVETGVERPLSAQVAALAGIAAEHGAEGVICSPGEVGVVKSVSERLLAVTPGIRPVGSAVDDQKRVATPTQALEAGADLLVVGRAITASEDPASAAAALAEEIAGVGNG